jgi:protein-tyrosine-phosphatase
VNPKAVAAMAEKGYDLTKHASKGLNDIPVGEYAAAITMGCGDECPNLKAKRKDDWPLPDPKTLPPEEFNRVRDEIEQRVIALLQSLEKSSGS